MGATILHIEEFRQRVQRRPEAAVSALKDKATQNIMAKYPHLPVATIARGVCESNNAIDAGGNMLDGMRASAKYFATTERGWLLQKARLYCLSAFLDVASRRIRAQMAGRPRDDFHLAMARARRVLEGGGTLCVALYHALGDDFHGGAA